MRTLGLVFVAALGACGNGGSTGADQAMPADLAMPSDLTPTLTSLSVTSNPPKILIGDKVTFNAFATYSDASMKDVSGAATWASSDTSVATMSGATATGNAKGSTSLTATLDGVTSPGVTLFVRSVDALALSWTTGGATPSAKPNGPPVQITSTATLSDADTLDVTTKAVWGSTDTSIIPLPVNGLLVPGNNNGTSTISATYAMKTATTSMLVAP